MGDSSELLRLDLGKSSSRSSSRRHSRRRRRSSSSSTCDRRAEEQKSRRAEEQESRKSRRAGRAEEQEERKSRKRRRAEREKPRAKAAPRVCVGSRVRPWARVDVFVPLFLDEIKPPSQSPFAERNPACPRQDPLRQRRPKWSRGCAIKPHTLRQSPGLRGLERINKGPRGPERKRWRRSACAR